MTCSISPFFHHFLPPLHTALPLSMLKWQYLASHLYLCVLPSLYLPFFHLPLTQPSIFSLPLWLSKAVSVITCTQPLTQQAKQWTNTSSATDWWHAGSQWHRVTGSHGSRRLHPTTPSASFRLTFSQLSSYFKGSTLPQKKGATALEELYPRMTEAGRVMIHFHNREWWVASSLAVS